MTLPVNNAAATDVVAPNNARSSPATKKRRLFDGPKIKLLPKTNTDGRWDQCVISAGGSCFQSVNYPSNYGTGKNVIFKYCAEEKNYIQ